ncbi:MAG: BA14K family protein [Hyphomicrobiaceae bacterium]
MRLRNVFTSGVMACLLAAGFLAFASTSDTALAGQLSRKPAKSVKLKAVGIKRLRPGQRIQVPIVPYIAYDYPYYYSRGFYPTHIGPGYIYTNYHVTNKRGYHYGGEAGDRHSAIERCSRKFRSFKRDTGHYTTYSGKKKLCPYLR